MYWEHINSSAFNKCFFFIKDFTFVLFLQTRQCVYYLAGCFKLHSKLCRARENDECCRQEDIEEEKEA